MNEQRATVSVAKDNGTSVRPVQTCSVTLSKLNIVLAMIGQLIAMFAVAITAASWVGNVLIEREFEERLKIFHAVAQPQIRNEMATALELHRRSGVHPGAMTDVQIERVIGALRREITTLQAAVEAFERTSIHQTEMIEELLRRSR